jgi:hypothetical protein
MMRCILSSAKNCFVFCVCGFVNSSLKNRSYKTYSMRTKSVKGGMIENKAFKRFVLQKAVKYFGHIISEDGLRPDPKLTEVIRNYPTPQNKNHVKSFLGLSGYYRKFIWDYSNKARALQILTRQKEEFR